MRHKVWIFTTLAATLLVAACASSTPAAKVEKTVTAGSPGANVPNPPGGQVQGGKTVTGGEEPPAAGSPAPASPAYTVSTLAGTGTAGYADGAGAQAIFSGPTGLAIAGDGALLVADHDNHAIRRIDLADPNHAVTTLAGSTAGGATAAGFADGAGAAARFSGPLGLAVGPDGTVYVADSINRRIRAISGNAVTTLAGNGTADTKNGVGTAAEFMLPTCVAVSPKLGLYVTDSADNRVRLVALTTGHAVTTVAGNGLPYVADDKGTAAEFNGPFGALVDASGNLIVADAGDSRLRQVAADTTVTSLPEGHVLGAVELQPTGIAMLSNGTLIVTDVGNHRLLAIPRVKTGQPDTRLIAGGGQGSKDGVGASALFNNPEGVAVGPDGTIYVADTDNNTIRMLSTGSATTPAGSGAATPTKAASGT